MKQFLATISLIPLSLMSEPALETDELSESDSKVSGEVSPVANKSNRINDASEIIVREVNNLQQIRNNNAFQDSNPTIGLFKEGVHLEKALQFTNAGISDIRNLSETPENLSNVINYVNEGVLSPAQVEKFARYCKTEKFGFEPGSDIWIGQDGTLADRKSNFALLFQYGKTLLQEKAEVKTPEDLIENFRPTNTLLLRNVTFEPASDVYLRTMDGAIAFDTFYSRTVEDQVERLTVDAGTPQEVTIEDGQLIIEIMQKSQGIQPGHTYPKKRSKNWLKLSEHIAVK